MSSHDSERQQQHGASIDGGFVGMELVHEMRRTTEACPNWQGI